MTAPQPSWKPKRSGAMGGAFASASTPPMGPVLPPPTRITQRHRPLGGTHGSNQTWIVSFTDIMGLMLTFFVLMYAMSERQAQDSTSTDGAPPVQYDRTFQGRPGDMGDSEELSLPRVRYEKGVDITYLNEILQDRQATAPGLALVQVKKEGGDILLMAPSELVTGKADDSDLVVKELVDVLTTLSNQVDLDITPGKEDTMASGFELARAVARRFQAEGYEPTMAVRVRAEKTTGDSVVGFRISQYVAQK